MFLVHVCCDVCANTSPGKGGRRRSEIDNLGAGLGEVEEGEEEDGVQRPSRQRAAKRVSKNAYTMDVMEELEYMDSPASSLHSSHSRGGDTGSSVGGGGKKDRKKPGRKKRRRRGQLPVLGKEEEEDEEEIAEKTEKTEPRVPPMKIKMIGRSGESDSPIFFAESVESWDEGSGNEKSSGRKKKGKEKEKKNRLKIKDMELEGDSGQSSPVVLVDDEVREGEGRGE